MSHLRIHQMIEKIRLKASSIYDRGRAMGKSETELFQDTEVMRATLREVLSHGVQEDLAGILYAIKAFQHEIKRHEEDIQFLKMKVENCQTHLAHLKGAVIERMKREGVSELTDSGFSVTYNEKKKGDELTIR